MRALVAAAALGLLAGPAGAGERPARVVSMNLCTDQLAMLLADPGQLVSVSRIAADPYSSPLAKEARAHRLNGGGAEEIFLMQPDLVLAADWSDPVSVAMLRRLGLAVIEVPIANSLDDIPGLVREVGAAIGQDARAGAMAAEAEARLAALPEPHEDGPVAAFYYAGGYSLGAGTLGDDIIGRAGFANLAVRLGQSGGGTIALETIVLEDPDILIDSTPYSGASRAESIARHPALDAFFEEGRVFTSGPEWVCGTPLTLGAVEEMAALRARIEARGE